MSNALSSMIHDGSVIKESDCNAGDKGDVGSIPGLGRSPGRAWQPTLVFLPEEPHGQRRKLSAEELMLLNSGVGEDS